MIQISAEYDTAGFGQFHIKTLVAGCMPGSPEQNDRPVTEHIIITVEQPGFGVLEGTESNGGVVLLLRRLFGKHHGSLGLLGKPDRTCKLVGVGCMIVMVMRHGKIGYVRGLKANFG